MWDYSEKMMDHFRNPRNVGEILDADGTATVGSLACGDALKFQFKLGPDGKIAEAKFKTFGCASAIASSSALTEMVIGKTLEEAKKITNQEIADYLGGLPPQKMHCSVMGREAMEAAIRNYETGENADKNLEEELICTCFNVSENEMRRVIIENQLNTVEEVTNFTKAGGGCGKCVEKIEALLKELGR
jgi:NifU-like protein